MKTYCVKIPLFDGTDHERLISAGSPEAAIDSVLNLDWSQVFASQKSSRDELKHIATAKESPSPLGENGLYNAVMQDSGIDDMLTRCRVNICAAVDRAAEAQAHAAAEWADDPDDETFHLYHQPADVMFPPAVRAGVAADAILYKLRETPGGLANGKIHRGGDTERIAQLEATLREIDLQLVQTGMAANIGTKTLTQKVRFLMCEIERISLVARIAAATF